MDWIASGQEAGEASTCLRGRDLQRLHCTLAAEGSWQSIRGEKKKWCGVVVVWLSWDLGAPARLPVREISTDEQETMHEHGRPAGRLDFLNA